MCDPVTMATIATTAVTAAGSMMGKKGGGGGGINVPPKAPLNLPAAGGPSPTPGLALPGAMGTPPFSPAGQGGSAVGGALQSNQGNIQSLLQKLFGALGSKGGSAPTPGIDTVPG